MRFLKLGTLLFAALLVSACGGSNVCDKPKTYQTSQPGKRVEPPEDLDALNSSREMTIPEPSPREPRPEGSRCLELPPTYGTDDNMSPAG